MPTVTEKEIFYPRNRRAWRTWLEKNHASSGGIWLMYYKKQTGKPTVTYAESVEEALCFGWIDSKPARLDEERHLLYFCPRKPKSVWSKLNKSRLEKLMAAGLMAPAGLATIEVAKRNGSWSTIDASENMIEPEDLVSALEANAKALGFWRAFPPSVRKAILQWIMSARRPETRAKRVEETVRLASENVRANQWRQ